MKYILILLCAVFLSACAVTPAPRSSTLKRINTERMCSAELNCKTYYPAP